MPSCGQCIRQSCLTHDKLQFVGEVADGVEAVQKARELKPDLILLDITLPHLNGIAVAKQVHEQHSRYGNNLCDPEQRFRSGEDSPE
jgi:DNA-binding NarL/FixJ family response regulator